ncbi:MAG: 6-hydroxymethylpterin diphosphokinase MptE-like protein [Treponemataceae bacterium]
MSDELRSRNKAILRERFPGLWEKIAETMENTSYELTLETSLRGEPTLRAKGLWVHSRFEPRKEAERLAALAEGDGPVVVLGFGLGYAAEAVSADNSRAVIVVEKDPRILMLAFEERDFSSFLSRRHLAFVVGGSADGVLAALDSFGGKPTLISNRTLRQLDTVWYDEAENSVRAWTSKDDVNTATLQRFGSRWVRNLVRNLEAVSTVPGISPLADSCVGLPAIIVAAGPTLDEILSVLPSIAQKCVVIAVDTALRAVLAAGVDPDFVVVVDPQYWNARHLDRCVSRKSALITESAVYPSVLSGHFSRTFLCSSLFPLGRFVENEVDPKGELGAGGSVATTAWDFARILGARPLWVAGLDLSFPGLKTHFKGALFEERTHTDAHMMNPGELRSFKALRDGFPFYAQDASGGAVLTDKRLALYASWFERRFRLFPDASPISLSSRGLRIAGMRTCTVDELTSLPDCRKEIDDRLRETFASIDQLFDSPSELKRRDTAFAKRIAELEGALGCLINVSENAATTASAALHDPKIAEKALAALDRANEQISGSSVKEVAGFLFPSAESLEKRITIDPSDQLGRHFEFSRLLYEKLAESAHFHLTLLKNRKTRKETRSFPDKHIVG